MWGLEQAMDYNSSPVIARLRMAWEGQSVCASKPVIRKSRSGRWLSAYPLLEVSIGVVGDQTCSGAWSFGIGLQRS
jgi:hypothetical protein